MDSDHQRLGFFFFFFLLNRKFPTCFVFIKIIITTIQHCIYTVTRTCYNLVKKLTTSMQAIPLFLETILKAARFPLPASSLLD